MPIIALAWVASLWWERGISYDDGGLGTLSFLVVYTIGYAGTWFGDLISPLVRDDLVPGSLLGHGFWLVSGIVACLPYLLADRWTQYWIAKQSAANASGT